MTKKLLSYFALAMTTIMLVVACNSDTQLQNDEVVMRSLVDPNVLQIWWDKGYSPEEDEALQKLIKGWSQKTGNKVQVNFYTLDKRSEKPQRYLQSGIAPDIFMSFKAESTLNASLAWEGKLSRSAELIAYLNKTNVC